MSNTNIPTIICKVKALYSYSSAEKSSLSFERDDCIDVLSQLESGWWDGWCKGNRGWFPSNYVQVIEMNSKNNKDVNKDNSDYVTLAIHSQDNGNDSEEEEARTIDFIKNMDKPTDVYNVNMTQPLNIKSNYNTKNKDHLYSHSHPQLFFYQQQPTINEEHEPSLPDGWSRQIAEDGITKFYFNQKTGGLRWNHPSISESDDDNYYTSDDDLQNMNNLKTKNRHKLVNFDDCEDFGAKKPNDDHDNSSSSSVTTEENLNLMAYWTKRTTPQGRIYYGNFITHETTWNFEDIDPSTGRLKKNDTNDHSDINDDNKEKQIKPLLLNKQTPLTWKDITAQIAQSVQDLGYTASRNPQSNALNENIIQVVRDVRHMLYSSRSLDRESRHSHDSAVKESIRVVLSALAKLILSTKISHDPDIDINSKIQRDSTDLLNAIRKFVLICQNRNIHIQPTSLKFVLVDSANKEPNLKTKRKSNTPTPLQKPKYPLNQDLIVSSQTHVKQILGSTCNLCSVLLSILSSEQRQQKSDKEALKADYFYIFDQRYKSNVFVLFQNISSQIGNYLAILGDIDFTNIDLSQITTFQDFRCNRQKLYNEIGLLFNAIQTLTDSQSDLVEAVHYVTETVKELEKVINNISSNIAHMVAERKAWLIKNGQYNGSKDATSWSPTCLENEKKKPGSSSGTDFDDSSIASSEHSNPSLFSRSYNKQKPNHKSSISATTASTYNTTRSTDGKTLRRQISYGNGIPTTSEDQSKLWFLGYDYNEGDIEFTMDKQIKGGTLRALVERLTLHNYIDMSYITSFLLTYRAFCTTEEFVDLLQERYNLIPPEGLTPEELDIWTEKKQKLVRLRVFNVMKNWLENYYNDEDEFILDKLQFFTDTVIYDSSAFSAEQLTRLIKKRRELNADGGGLKKLIPNTIYGPMPILPKNLQKVRLLETDPLEIARQLTIMDFKVYSSIQPIECLGKAWSKDGSENAPNVKQSIDYCNKLTSWVTGSILSSTEAKKRVIVVKYWAQVANHCIEMNNYNTCLAILSAFDNSAIGRLKRTWELVSNRTCQSLAQIRKIMGSNSNFKEYREMIHSVNPPCIPFLGIYLQDLTFIEDGNPDFLKHPDNLINFAKQQKFAEVIREIKQFQSPPYIFQFVPEIQDYIKEQLEVSRDIDYHYARSLAIEPKFTTNYEHSYQ